MKKSFMKMGVLTILLLSSSIIKAQTVNLQKEIEELSYALGLAQTKGLAEYLTDKLDVDMTYKNAFLKGVIEGAENNKDKEKIAYFAGIQIGQQIGGNMVEGINKELFGTNSEFGISLKEFLEGFITGVNGVSEEELEKTEQFAQDKMVTVKAIMLEKELKK